MPRRHAKSLVEEYMTPPRQNDEMTNNCMYVSDVWSAVLHSNYLKSKCSQLIKTKCAKQCMLYLTNFYNICNTFSRKYEIVVVLQMRLHVLVS